VGCNWIRPALSTSFLGALCATTPQRRNNPVRCQLVSRRNYLALCLILLSALVTSLYDGNPPPRSPFHPFPAAGAA